MIRSVRSGALAAYLFASLIVAQASIGASGDNSLKEVVVSATRILQPADQALEPVLIIDRAALEDSMAVDVGEALRFHAGLDIGRTGGPGQQMSLFIRGANSNHSIVMIDGVRINSGTSDLAPLVNLSPELFERIEIVKGPRSAIYGTDAIGGVVNLITRSGGASGADIMLDYGRYGTGEFALDGNYTSGKTSLQVALSGQKTHGFPAFETDSVDRGYKNLSGTAAFTTHLGGMEIGARFWRASGNTQYSSAATYNSDFTVITSFTELDEGFSNSVLAAHASGDLTDLWHARVTLSRIVDDLRQHQPDVFSNHPLPDYDTTSRNTIDLQNDVKIVGADLSQLLTFGATVAREQTNSLSFGTQYSLGTSTQNYYLQDQLGEGQNRLLLSIGEAHHPAFGNHATWNAEYGYVITTDTLFTMSAGTAFRAPSATDRFGYGGTPNLLPESSRNFELGIKSRLATHQQVMFAAFQNTINDLIVGDPNNNFVNRNISRARIRGIEASWELRADPWALRAEGSIQDPRNLDSTGFIKDTQLLRRSKHSFTLSGSRKIGQGELGLDLLQAGARADGNVATGTPVHDGGYFLAAFRGKIDLTPQWSMSTRLDNAFNRHYELASGYSTPGRSASIATRYSFR